MDQASNEYLHNAVMTATPERLHLMLYDGAIRFTRQGLDGIGRGDWEQAFNGLSRAQKIVLELLNSLNYEVDENLCTKMAGLYHFIYQRLVEASTRREVKPGEEALELLEYQRQTWVLLIDKLREQRADEASSSTDAQHEAGVQGAPVEVAEEMGEASYGTLSVQG